MSESGYNTVDQALNYQYRAFGVPGLGLKRGLADERVIAPYATVMALMLAPEAACANLERLAALGALGTYGFFEALDYSPARQRRGHSYAVVRSFMAHHQGMSLLALLSLLRQQPMQKRFASMRQFQAVMLLLEERVPRTGAMITLREAGLEHQASAATAPPIRVFSSPDGLAPAVQLLSNGRYHMMLSQAGGGYSRWNGIAVTRWREDSSCDHWGSFCYIRELGSKTYWSNSFQPTRRQPESYEAIFSEGRVEYRRRDFLADAESLLETHTEIVVSPEDDIELRRLRITNRSRQRCVVELTSYAEVVIAPQAQDAQHPAFSKLFVQTEILRERHAIVCSRRPRALGESPPWMLHLMVVHGASVSALSFETDRMRFIGRGRDVAAPLAMEHAGPLGGSEGSVLDPVVAIRYCCVIEAEHTATVDIMSGIAADRDGALALVDKYQDRHLADRVFDLAWTHSQVALRQLNISDAQAQLYSRLAGVVVYARAALRADAAILRANRRGQSGLWGYAISGDLPIVLLKIGDAANLELVSQLIHAHAYWRQKGLAVDLVIWNEDHAGYRQRLQEQILGLIASGLEAGVMDRPGGIFLRLAEQISAEDRSLFLAVARAVISDAQGSLAEQLDRAIAREMRPPRLLTNRSAQRERDQGAAVRAGERRHANGLGGYNLAGDEYLIEVSREHPTPAPWVNVLANAEFGCVVSERGSAYTWAENAHEFRLSPWHNDPVSDPSGEALYLRDEESGQYWSPTLWPAGAEAAGLVRHGFGYSVFETSVSGIHSELWVFVAEHAALKFLLLKLRNDSARPRRLSVTGYVEWVLGGLRENTAMHIHTELDAQSGAVLARNPYNTEFGERVAFFDVDDPTRTVCGDRGEFIGRNGSLSAPAALLHARLSGRLGAGLDPCAALQVSFELAEGQSCERVFRLGVGADTEAAQALLRQFRGNAAAHAELAAVRRFWRETLTVLSVSTPEPAVDLLCNGWLLYQTLACRLWARSGFYQSGGAFGFRDQLQDAMALVHVQPQYLRAHLLRCAGRQFLEGDVQHWWHPPAGRGVRTRCADDFLWLPLALSRYLAVSADYAVLDERVPFLEGRAVNAEDESYYDLPGQAAEFATLYEHCVRALRHGLRFGSHGLPLMGSGDWNDGMNRVGIEGKGESVWLGFFLCEVWRQFAPVAALRGDVALVAEGAALIKRLGADIETHGWDGAWYRRAYFDDGRALGSQHNSECRIDSIAQSWAVLSGVASPARAAQAMDSLERHLLRRDSGLVQLLDPPFDSAELDPGYIRGYLPGVRENGGQYTHAAIWAAMAFAAQGDSARAWEITRLIHPLQHSATAAAAQIYKVEPYVISADVYACAPHTGRGGWSWYTGSAGWMYRLFIESLLGLRREGQRLWLQPCLPAQWPGFTLSYRHGTARYHLEVSQVEASAERPPGWLQISCDGVQCESGVLLQDDGREHQLAVLVSRHAQSS